MVYLSGAGFTQVVLEERLLNGCSSSTSSSSIVCQSVCQSSEPRKNIWTDRHAAWVEDSGVSKEPCIRQRCTLAPPGEYHWTVRVWQQCGQLSNNFRHLFISGYLPRSTTKPIFSYKN